MKRYEELMTKLENGAPREGAKIQWLKDEVKKTGLIWSKSDMPNIYWIIEDNTQELSLVKFNSRASQEYTWIELEESNA